MSERVQITIRAQYQVGVSKAQHVGRQVTGDTENAAEAMRELVTEALRQINTELKALIR